jgi:ankyrin repeat protein
VENTLLAQQTRIRLLKSWVKTKTVLIEYLMARAIHFNKSDIVREIISIFTNWHLSKQEFLHDAASKGSISKDIVEILVDDSIQHHLLPPPLFQRSTKQKQIGQTPYFLALVNGSRDSAGSLLNKMNQHAHEFKDIITKSPNFESNSPPWIGLKDKDGDLGVAFQKTSPLHVAVDNKRGDGVLHLIGETYQIINYTDENGQTALHIASKNGDMKSIKYLLDLGADPNIQDAKGQTALHIITYYHNLEGIQELGSWCRLKSPRCQRTNSHAQSHRIYE